MANFGDSYLLEYVPLVATPCMESGGGHMFAALRSLALYLQRPGWWRYGVSGSSTGYQGWGAEMEARLTTLCGKQSVSCKCKVHLLARVIVTLPHQSCHWCDLFLFVAASTLSTQCTVRGSRRRRRWPWGPSFQPPACLEFSLIAGAKCGDGRG